MMCWPLSSWIIWLLYSMATLRARPPNCEAASSNITLMPLQANVDAAARPAMPPPMTTTCLDMLYFGMLKLSVLEIGLHGEKEFSKWW